MYRIAIVDDEAIVRKGMMNLVSWANLGCKVVCEAADGQDLLDVIDRVQPDIVITDIKMPRMDGLAPVSYTHLKYKHMHNILAERSLYSGRSHPNLETALG